VAMIEVAMNRFAEQARTAQLAESAASALSDHRLVDRAKGLIMLREGVSELEAYNRLEQRARRERRTLLDVAEEVGAELGAEGSEATRE
jgi:response regulator NasT